MSLEKQFKSYSTIDNLEVRQTLHERQLQEQRNDLRELNSKVSTLSGSLERLNTTLPYLIQELGEMVGEFKDFKSGFISQQLLDEKTKHDKELKNLEKVSEVHGKVKLIWSGLGVILGALIVTLIKIFIVRF